MFDVYGIIGDDFESCSCPDHCELHCKCPNCDEDYDYPDEEDYCMDVCDPLCNRICCDPQYDDRESYMDYGEYWDYKNNCFKLLKSEYGDDFMYVHIWHVPLEYRDMVIKDEDIPEEERNRLEEEWVECQSNKKAWERACRRVRKLSVKSHKIQSHRIAEFRKHLKYRPGSHAANEACKTFTENLKTFGGQGCGASSFPISPTSPIFVPTHVG